MELLKKNKLFIANLIKKESNQFFSTTNDPQIWFLFDKPLKYGWYKIKTKIEFSSVEFAGLTAKIYFDFGQGFFKESACVFNIENDKEVILYFKLNRDCSCVRLDPHENISGNVDFRISYFELKGQSKYRVLLDHLLRNRKKLKSSFRESIKSIGKTITNIRKDVKANAIDFVELPKHIELGKNIENGEKVFHDMAYFLKNKSEHYKEKREFSVFNSGVKPIAFYLPQYHTIKENDDNWGTGFTEWTNVTKAFSQFPNHYQPHLPGDLGFYNLTDKNTIEKQIATAKLYGIYGFCIYHYWFEGKRVLEKPLDIITANKDLDLNFMLCWANENWTKRWDGLDSHILLQQNHNRETDAEYLNSIITYFKDPRYIRVDNRPVLMVYKPTLFPDFKETALHWRKIAKENGFDNLHLLAVKGFGCDNPEDFGLDGLVEFPPATPAGYIELDTLDKQHINMYNPDFSGNIYDYRKLADNLKKLTYENTTVYKGIMPSWDNTARRNDEGHIFHFSDPVAYQNWLYRIAEYTTARYKEDNRFIFINAWNEWAEGTHLEPDRYYGYCILDKTAQVLEYFPRTIRRIESSKPEIGFCIHIYHIDIWDEINKYLEELKLKFELFISIAADHEPAKILKEKILKQYPTANVKLVENRGRDILPFILFVDEIFETNCKYLCKIHTKKSFHRDDGDRWRKDLYNKLMGSHELVSIIHDYFVNYPQIGIIGPEGHLLNTRNYWGENTLWVSNLLNKLNYKLDEEYHFVAGGMFWMRVDILRELEKLNPIKDDFEPEQNIIGVKDGTISHAIERIFSICCFIQNKEVVDTRIFNGHMGVPFSDIKRHDPNNYDYAIPIPGSFRQLD